MSVNTRATMWSCFRANQVQITIFCMLIFGASYFYHAVDWDNTLSRFFLTSAIVDYRTLSVDAYKDQTRDLSFADGHYYSNKAIGASLLAVPVYWGLRYLPWISVKPPLQASERYFVRIVTTALPFAVLGVVMFRLACRWTPSQRGAFWVVLAYAFGTIALVHATLFSGHEVAACFAFFSFAMLFELKHTELVGERSGLRDLFVALGAGLCAGLTALADYPATFIAVVLSIYMFSSKIAWKKKVLFFLGGLACMLVLAAYNWRCFGSPFSPSYGHLSLPEFREGTEHGFFGINLPRLGTLLNLLFSPSRGLFFIMPVFLFSFFGFVRLWDRKDLRAEALVIMAIVTGFLVINSGYFGWHGGAIYGPRYLVPMLPFLAIPIVFADLNSGWFRVSFLASVLLVAPAIVGIPHTPELIKNPICELILPCIMYGYQAENWGSWLGLNPWWGVAALVVVLVSCARCAFKRLPASDATSAMKPWQKVIVGTWLSGIIVMLAFVRTQPRELVEYHFANALFTLAASQRYDARPQQAAVIYADVLRIWPEHSEAEYNWGLLLLKAGDYVQAKKHLQAAVRIKPAFAKAQACLGYLYRFWKRPADAERAFRLAVLADPTIADAYLELGRTLAAQGKFAEAVQTFRRGLEVEPRHMIMGNEIAWIMATAPDPAVRNAPQAIQIGERLAELTGRKEFKPLDTLAAAYAEAGRFDDATRTAREALALVQVRADTNSMVSIEERLRFYERRQPYRQTGP